MQARPIVKWAGGKGRLVPALRRHVPPKMRTYVEPFAGGAALFFALASETPRPFERAVLCDMNEELVACYRAVQSDVEAVIAALGKYKYDREVFYKTRERDTRRLGDVARAARLIYLNRTCYNGLWRVNSKGKFNVPFGRYTNPLICDAKSLRAASAALAGVELRVGDFSSVTSGLGRGDFVYFDPPYVPVSKTADFTSYAKGGFGPEEQERLVCEMRRLARAGVGTLLSNADTPGTRALYRQFVHHTVDARRSINSDSRKRGPVRELLVRTEVAHARR